MRNRNQQNRQPGNQWNDYRQPNLMSQNEDWRHHENRGNYPTSGHEYDFNSPQSHQNRDMETGNFPADRNYGSPRNYESNYGSSKAYEGSYGQGSSYENGGSFENENRYDEGRTGRSNSGFQSNREGYGQQSNYGGYGEPANTGRSSNRANEDYGRRENTDWGTNMSPNLYNEGTRSGNMYGQTGRASQYLGEHKGKGPKNYRRSNDRIIEDINDRLTDDHSLDASDIEAKIENNDVILTGTVSDRFAKRRAEEIAESVSGVTNVENRIKLKSTSASGGTELETGRSGSTQKDQKGNAGKQNAL